MAVLCNGDRAAWRPLRRLPTDLALGCIGVLVEKRGSGNEWRSSEEGGSGGRPGGGWRMSEEGGGASGPDCTCQKIWGGKAPRAKPYRDISKSALVGGALRLPVNPSLTGGP